jgi:hypothetical protein
MGKLARPGRLVLRPLFTHLFSHAWIDYRGIQDEFMRQEGSDYFENTQRVQSQFSVNTALGIRAAMRDTIGIVGA